jgi:tetratricopeptide (TPR) repeat protein
LLGELVATGLAGDDEATPLPVLDRVSQLVHARLQALPAAARGAVEAAAVFVQPVPPAALRHLAGLPDEALDEAALRAWASACDSAIATGLLRRDGSALACRHDLIRQAITTRLPASRREALHRHAALWLAAQPDAVANDDALAIAEHWRAAGEPQTAWAWCHRGAEQLKARGRFDEARALWHGVADASLDAAQALRARLELAACDLFADLARGQAALDAVHAQLGAVADLEQRRQIEGRVLAALVDNRVFAGDIARARSHASRLRELLPTLPLHEQIDALEVLIELAMREPDIPGAWALLAQLRGVAPQRPTLLSFEGQIHWFGGHVQAAHDSLARLLQRHPDYCCGITVENDLAVMLQALGRIEEAETMARRSLQSWAGVAHTETLSLLVLGLVLTSAGRHGEAEAALQRALALARAQSSPGFEAEALVRLARLQLQGGHAEAAQQALDQAAPLLASSSEPLRVSQLVLAQVLAASRAGQAVSPPTLQRLASAAQASAHPLVQVRLARVQFEVAWQAGNAAAASAAALCMAQVAQGGGLLEPLAEAWLLQAQARQLGGETAAQVQPLVAQAAACAQRQGLANIQQRAQAWLAAMEAPSHRPLAARQRPRRS